MQGCGRDRPFRDLTSYLRLHFILYVALKMPGKSNLMDFVATMDILMDVDLGLYVLDES